MDDEMESAFRSANMEFLDPAQLDLAAETAGSDFDDLFSHITSSRQTRPNAGPEPAKPYPNGHPLEQPPTVAADFPVESPDNSSRSSSSESPRNHLRQASTTSTTSNAHSENHSAALGCPSEDWMMRSELASVKDEAPLHIEPSYIMAGNYSMNPDMKMSDKAMDAAFDFESAASSPGPFLTQGQSQRNSQRQPKSPIWSPSSASAVLAPHEVAAPASVSHPILFIDHCVYAKRIWRLPGRARLSTRSVSRNSRHSRARRRNGLDSPRRLSLVKVLEALI